MALTTTSKPVAKASKHTYRLCKTEYISRNELFHHLNDSYMADTPPTVLIIANVAATISPFKAAFLPILKESKSPEIVSVSIGGFI